MASHNDLGKEAEEAAVHYFKERGYKILCTNWRFSHFEIDIIADKDDRLRIIEVKSLRSPVVKFPEQGVTREKFRRLVKAADIYLSRNRMYRHIQFDVLAIIMWEGKKPEFLLIEDVFF